MRTRTVLSILFAVACGGSSNGNPSSDASSANDASSTSDASAGGGSTIKISGVATQLAVSGDPVPADGVLIAAYTNSDENTAVASAMTASDGSYTLTVPIAAGASLDGFLKATKPGNATTYLYPPAPLSADFAGAAINEITTTTYSALSQFIGGGTATQGLIALEVVDSASSLTPVAGAVVTSTPETPKAKTGYTGSSGLPDTSKTETTADGRAFLFSLAPGAITVTATKPDATFKTTSLNVHANAFTTTLVTE